MQTPNPNRTAEQAEAEAALDFRWLLDDQRGRRIARSILRWSGIEEVGPTSGESAMAWAAGARSIGSLLRATMRKHYPEGWVRLEAEHTRELCDQAERERALAAAGTKAVPLKELP